MEDVRPVEMGAAARWARRAGIAVLLVIVLLGAIGFFGVRSRTTTTTSHGYTMSVTYPQAARAGLDVPWRVRVHRDGGLPNQLTLAVSTDYFRMFETQGFFPDPDTQKNDGRFVYFTYQGPPAHVMEMEYDAYIQPAEQLGKGATVKVLVAGVPVASATIRTWLVP
jgi:hypothetical protein